MSAISTNPESLPKGVLERVKLIHSEDLDAWTCLPSYDQANGTAYAHYLAEAAKLRALENQFSQAAKILQNIFELETDEFVDCGSHRIDVKPSLWPSTKSFTLPEPAYRNSIITIEGQPIEQRSLQLRSGWEQKTVHVSYSCPKRDRFSDEIAGLRSTLASLSEQEQQAMKLIAKSRFNHPVLFISHRWGSNVHPDPHAEQLAKLKQLKNCFMIYDYTSFPQIFHERDDRHDLNLVLNYMNNLVSNVVILGSPDYLQRGWCIYEYLASSFTGSLVCDEVQDPTFVELRDWVHTYAPIPPTRFLFRDSKESMQQNYINDAILTAVNRILPLFKDAAFSVQHDRSSVSQLLRLVLKERLPSKKEHQPYLNEWKTVEWTEQELDDAFERTLTWDAGERGRIARFKMRVPDSIETAARRRFRLDLPKSPLQLWSEGGWRA